MSCNWRPRSCAIACCCRSPPKPSRQARTTWSRRCCAACRSPAERVSNHEAIATGFIPPQVRARLKDLRLTSRRAVGLQGIGLHHSRSRGAGLEFAQYRAYEPGDELRQIDWKLYARSDRFFVREAERESPLTVWILIDASASMAQQDGARAGWSRMHAAKALAACVAELALRQGDRFGLVALQGEGLRLAPPGGGARQRDRLLLELHGLAAQGAFPDAERLTPLWERIAAG